MDIIRERFRQVNLRGCDRSTLPLDRWLRGLAVATLSMRLHHVLTSLSTLFQIVLTGGWHRLHGIAALSLRHGKVGVAVAILKWQRLWSLEASP